MMTDLSLLFKNILSRDKLFFDQDSIDLYSRSTLQKGTRPAGIIKPESVNDIKTIVDIANKAKIGLYPISCGKNWGYGDACAVKEGQLIVDLSRMNKILEVNESLAYAVIEPGVTQLQLYEYLKSKNIPLWLDCTGSGPEASILGNTLERGFGHTPYGDHFLHSCGMEIILGDGRALKTGFGHYKKAPAAYVYKWAIGPYLDGLFTQSNFGIVVKLGVWLMPEPQCCNMFFCPIHNNNDLSKAVNALRPFKLSGQIKSLVHIGNDLRVISSFQRYPWKEAGNITPLSDQLRARFRKKGRFGAWNISGAIYGSTKQVALTRSELKKALKPIGRIIFFGKRSVELAGRLGRLLERLRIMDEYVIKLKSLEKVYGLLRGEPTDAFLYGTLWRLKGELTNSSLDPLDHNAGMLWVSPILPMTGEDAERLMTIVTPVFKKYGFEPLITITLITERAMVSVITISYDKSNEIETQMAAACYKEFFELIMMEGYIPYRTNIRSMKHLAMNSDTFWDVTKELKQIFDPNDIISSGRYQPKSFEQN